MTLGEGRERWRERYTAGDRDGPPSRWVMDAAQDIPPGATIVELAGGNGRHARALAALGRRTVLLDFVEPPLRSARRRAPGLDAVLADVWELPFADHSLHAILVVNFLERGLFPQLRRLLVPGGLLIYETFTWEQPTLREGAQKGPTSPDHLLAPDELPRLCAPLVPLRSREGVVEDAAGRRACASILAVNASPTIATRGA